MDVPDASLPPLSILDLALVSPGESVRTGLDASVELARKAEKWGYRRIWYAEHHNMRAIASSATSVLIGHVAAHTERITLGAGGIMLPNHAPLVIAEQFGTLESLFPGRVDLGLGRAPGTDQAAARALRRSLDGGADRFPEDVLELIDYFAPAAPDQRVRAIPGEGLRIPVWILGSSLYGAQLAAMLGLPYAFASHFAPQAMMEAIRLYRESFRPSEQLKAPYVMLGYNLFAADSDEEAELLATSLQQAFVALRGGRPVPLQPPVAGYPESLAPPERATLDQLFSCSAVGGPDRVKAQIEAFVERTGADELILTSQVYDHAARLRSFEIAAQLFA